MLLSGPEPWGGAGLGTTVINQAALTRLDFQHIKQVGLSIEVTPSVSAEGGKRRGCRASLPAAPTPSWAEKAPLGEGDGGSRVCVGGVSASCPHTQRVCSAPSPPRHGFSGVAAAPEPNPEGAEPHVPSTTRLTYASSPLRPPKLRPGAWLPPPTSPRCGTKGWAQGGHQHFGHPLLQVRATPRAPQGPVSHPIPPRPCKPGCWQR